jgi:glyoxylase-like metal-dependent hydrolase (beta-lactamase superfamily II)
MRLYCMTGGHLTFDQSTFTHMQGMGQVIQVPTPIFLIDHPAGKVLFETGLHPAVAVDAEWHWGDRARAWKPRMTPEQAADQQLARLGVAPEDIRYVVLSCLLPDHAGGMHLFPGATFVVQFQELQDAWWPDRRYLRYEFPELLPTRPFAYLELHGEDLDLFDDGAVQILACPAHTRGEQALVVRLPRTGTVVLPAGVIPQRANLERTVMTAPHVFGGLGQLSVPVSVAPFATAGVGSWSPSFRSSRSPSRAAESQRVSTESLRASSVRGHLPTILGMMGPRLLSLLDVAYSP